MLDVANVAIEILSPHVGDIVAKMCVKTAADSCGKTPDQLEVQDVPTLLRTVKMFLGPVAPHETVETLVARIDGRLS